jgi:hypothetical protein
MLHSELPWRGLVVKKTWTLGLGERPAGEMVSRLATQTHKVFSHKKAQKAQNELIICAFVPFCG